MKTFASALLATVYFVQPVNSQEVRLENQIQRYWIDGKRVSGWWTLHDTEDPFDDNIRTIFNFSALKKMNIMF